MISKTAAHEIKECRELVEAALWSDTYQSFISNLIDDIDIYESRQWSQADLDTIQKAGLKPVTVNLISQRLDALAGKEAATRNRWIFKSRSGQPDEVERATALSKLSLFIQEKNRTSRILTEARHHARIGGLGWHSFTVEDGFITEETENPLEVIWDVQDRTPLLTNQGFVARVKWMTLDEAKQRFPKRAEALEKAGNAGTGLDGYSAFGWLSAHGSLDSRYKLYRLNGYWDEKNREVAVIECQYREPATYWSYPTEDGYVINTFDYEEARKNASDKKAITESDGYKVYFSYWAGDVDLDHFESPFQIDPNKGLFTLTPTVYARSMMDGVPYGLVGKAKDSQRLYNTKQAKINWLMAARQVVMDKGAVDDVKSVRAEINNPSAVIVKNPGKELRFDKHEGEIAQHYQALALHKADIEAAMGIYDETLGIETNAQSGVAIQRRQVASNSTQQYAMDGFSEAQRIIANKQLGLIRSVITEQTVIDVTDDEEDAKRLEFNKTIKGADGKVKRALDVRVGNFDVVVEQIPDTDTLNEVAQLRLMEMIQAGFTPDKWTVGMLDLFNVPKGATIRKEIEAGLQQKLQELEQLKAQQPEIANRPQGQMAMPGGGPSALQTPMGAQ